MLSQVGISRSTVVCVIILAVTCRDIKLVFVWCVCVRETESEGTRTRDSKNTKAIILHESKVCAKILYGGVILKHLLKCVSYMELFMRRVRLV